MRRCPPVSYTHLAFLDADDWWDVRKTAEQLAAIEERYQFARGGLNPQIPASRDAFAAGFALIQ